MSVAEQLQLNPRPLTEAVAEARQIVETAIDRFDSKAIMVGFSGGNDSKTVAHLFRDVADVAVLADTTIAIPETQEFVRQRCADWRLDLVVRQGEYSYAALCERINGFPGPGQHYRTFISLKERALFAGPDSPREMLKKKRSDKILLLSGARAEESKRRMGHASVYAIDESYSAVIWVNPLYRWTARERDLYLALNNVPANEVTEHLHMSGECLCGAMASPGEIHGLELFYPDVAAEIHDLERHGHKQGWKYCTWGHGQGKPGKIGRMCMSCVGQQELQVSP